MLLFRVFYRFNTADTAPDAQSLYDAEFEDKHGRPDLEPSLYEVHHEAVAQTLAEHAAAAPISPPGRKAGIDVRSTGEQYYTDETSAPFHHIRTAHRVLRFSDAAALRAFVGRLYELKESGAAECVRVAGQDIRDYVRLHAKDDEWSLFLASASKDWRKYAGV
ncbi:hypothetical protein WME76_01280 [Sorangium sp. So ce119]|uniref:hypothetical protein n=1 Tax=Sorangium sp. So ce119 TaxID=3133279 RepID=UPI003F63B6BD